MDFMQFLAGAVLGLLVSEYFRSKKEFHYHALASLYVGLPYIMMEYLPQWLNESVVRGMVIVIYTSLIGRAIKMCNPRVSRAIHYILILVTVVWWLVTVFV